MAKRKVPAQNDPDCEQDSAATHLPDQPSISQATHAEAPEEASPVAAVGTKSNIVPVRESLHTVIKNLERNFNRKQPDIRIIPTGLISLDNLIIGLKPGELTVVGSRPSMGKTSLMLGLLEHIGMILRIPTLYFSPCAANSTVTVSLVSNNCLMESAEFQRVDSVNRDWIKLTKVASQLCESPIWIDDTPGPSIQSIVQTCSQWAKDCFETENSYHDGVDRCGVILIDGIRNIETEQRYPNRTQELSEVSRTLKALARRLNIPIVVTSGISAWMERKRPGDRPMLHELLESDGALEEDADNIIFICKTDSYMKKNKAYGISEFAVAKQRNGPTGSFRLAYFPQYMRFQELPENKE